MHTELNSRDSGLSLPVTADDKAVSSSNANQFTSARKGLVLLTLSVGGMTCSSCSITITDLVSDLPGVSQVNVNLLGQSATVLLGDTKLVGAVVETIVDAGYKTEVISIEFQSQQKFEVEDVSPYRLTLSVDGMTRSSCATSITKMVSDLSGVSEAAVSLLSKSVVVIINEKSLAGIVLDTISDSGFTAEIVNVQAMGTTKDDDAPKPRVVSLKVGGMFCRWVLCSFHSTTNLLRIPFPQKTLSRKSHDSYPLPQSGYPCPPSSDHLKRLHTRDLICA